MFDSMIKPILLYNSEFWGAFLHKNIGNNFMNVTYAASQDVNSYVQKFHSKYVNESCKFTEKLITMPSDANWEKTTLFVEILCSSLKYYFDILQRNKHSSVRLHFWYINYIQVLGSASLNLCLFFKHK